MFRRRHVKEKNRHFAILVNRAAGKYDPKAVSKLIAAIKKANASYTVFEPANAMDFAHVAQTAAQLNKEKPSPDQNVARRGPVTALVACGGDGTFNLAARSVIDTDIPIGIIPMGKMNNAARSLYGSVSIDTAITKVVSGNYKKIDVGQAADQPFFVSVGLGFVPELVEEIRGSSLPRFGFGWSQLGGKAAARVKMVKSVIKIDAFKFEAEPIMFNVHLMPFAATLPFSTASLTDDGEAEVIFDLGNKMGEFSTITRMIQKNKFLYGSDVRMYRGKSISVHPVRGRVIYLDGELIPLPTNTLSIKTGEKQIKAFC
jgi:diacylglycerol kinase family enzyme